jgi:hypothetical protein
MPMKQLNQYLKECKEKDIHDHHLRVSHIDDEGNLHFYIHPRDVDGDTCDFVAQGINTITTKAKYEADKPMRHPSFTTNV